ncbi:hypothetical protein CVS40_11709 [Lucilia cuprina]|nr:hypothetical protein CVS40_11709 [Lucilia cuprina]
MSLTLIEGLREARSLPPFSGSTEYALTSYLRDVNTVLSLVGEEHKATIRSVLANRLQGKALKAIETLVVPTWEQIIAKLREEFGVRESFLGLRNQAMNVAALSVEELHHKLNGGSACVIFQQQPIANSWTSEILQIPDLVCNRFKPLTQDTTTVKEVGCYKGFSEPVDETEILLQTIESELYNIYLI